MVHEKPILINEIKRMHMNFLQFAHAEINSHWRSTPQIASHNFFYMILKGEADVYTNGKRTHMTPGNIYVIPAGTLYNGICQEYCHKVYFYGNFLNSAKERIPIAPHGCIILPHREQQIQKNAGAV